MEQPVSKNSTEQSGSKKGVHIIVDKEAYEFGLFNVASPGKVTPWNVNVDMEGVAVTMQLYTRASLSLMSETTLREHWPQRTLSSSEVRLSSYSGESIPLLGSVDVKVTYKCQSFTVPLIMVKGSGITLTGHNWLQMFKLDWQEIFVVNDKSILYKHAKLFEEGLGTLTGFQAKIVVDPSAQPKFCKARTVLYFFT